MNFKAGEKAILDKESAGGKEVTVLSFDKEYTRIRSNFEKRSLILMVLTKRLTRI